MSSPQAAIRHRQWLDELCAAALRALTGDGALHYRGHRLYRGRKRLPYYAAHLHPAAEAGELATLRGAADGLAQRLTHSDEALHRALQPEDLVERALFDLLEQLRCESLVDPQQPGMRRNLQLRFEEWLRQFHHSGHTETAAGLLVFTFTQIARARLTGDPILEETEDLMEATRAGIGPEIGHPMAALRRLRQDQAAYAEPARALAAWLARQLANAAAIQGTEADQDKAIDTRIALGIRLEADTGEPEDEDQGSPSQVRAGHRRGEAAPARYLIFTTAYDREANASTLVRPAQLRELREQLDRHLEAQSVNVPRVARELVAALARPLSEDWALAQEEGLIDGRRLAQLVASPTERRLFRQPVQEPTAEACVTFLVDCSGSMRAHREAVAALVDVYARALELAGASCEVLGFTTGGWNGGRAARDWQRAGRPGQPGRLNELLHIVFKDAVLPWRRTRQDLAALLKEDNFREGIDGEALQWAALRLQARPEPRKLLLVVSDGCPMDAATHTANGPGLLDQHLQQVAADIEAGGAIELLAVGVGLDLSQYYRRSLVIDLAEGLRHRVFTEVTGCMRRRH